jgi:hypothetical protein
LQKEQGIKMSKPEEMFDATPRGFSAASGLFEVKRADNYRGIVLDSLEEVASALLRNANFSKAAAETMAREMATPKGGVDVAFIPYTSVTKKADDQSQIARLVSGVLASLGSRGWFYCELDADIHGSKKALLTASGERVYDRFVLKLTPNTFPANDSEATLARAIGKHKALRRATAIAEFGVVDDYWFDIDLGSLLSRIGLTGQEISAVTTGIAASNYNDGATKPELVYEKDKQRFGLDIRLEANTGLRPVGQAKAQYLQARDGNHIVGAAWEHLPGEYGFDISPLIKRPGIVVSVTMPDYCPIRQDAHCEAVSREQIVAVKTARDEIARKLLQG